ncbi:hypothetical protein D9M71_335530 [compost metagenome]
MLAAAGAVGVADDLDAVLVELLEGVRQVVQRAVEGRRDVRRVGGEGDVARHDQLDVVALALDLHAGALHLPTQFGFLLVGVVAVARGGGAHRGGADQRTLATVVMVDGGTGDGAGQCAQRAVLGGLAHATLGRSLGVGVVGILRGATGHEGKCGDGRDHGQTTCGKHEGKLLGGRIRPGGRFCLEPATGLRHDAAAAPESAIGSSKREKIPCPDAICHQALTKGFSRISSPRQVSGP